MLLSMSLCPILWSTAGHLATSHIVMVIHEPMRMDSKGSDQSESKLYYPGNKLYINIMIN